jgi:hypothetical protein
MQGANYFCETREFASQASIDLKVSSSQVTPKQKPYGFVSPMASQLGNVIVFAKMQACLQTSAEHIHERL